MNLGKGMVSRASRYSVSETLDRLEGHLRDRRIKIFARIDHGAGAAEVGLAMPPCQLLIFGNPRGGTPIMLAAPPAAIDLPFKALAWQDAQGKVWLSYNEPTYIAERFGLTAEQVETIRPLVASIEDAAT
jgi:uncharacterized protein (DUF302 family)